MDYNHPIAFGTPGNQNFPTQIILRAERLAQGKDGTDFCICQDRSQWIWEKHPDVVSQRYYTMQLLIISRFHPYLFAYAALSTGVGYYHFPASTLAEIWQQDQRTQF